MGRRSTPPHPMHRLTAASSGPSSAPGQCTARFRAFNHRPTSAIDQQPDTITTRHRAAAATIGHICVDVHQGTVNHCTDAFCSSRPTVTVFIVLRKSLQPTFADFRVTSAVLLLAPRRLLMSVRPFTAFASTFRTYNVRHSILFGSEMRQ